MVKYLKTKKGYKLKKKRVTRKKYNTKNKTRKNKIMVGGLKSVTPAQLAAAAATRSRLSGGVSKVNTTARDPSAMRHSSGSWEARLRFHQQALAL